MRDKWKSEWGECSRERNLKGKGPKGEKQVWQAQGAEKEDGWSSQQGWPEGQGWLVTSERAGRGQVMWCPLGIAKEAGFYFRCQGKTLKSFKKGKKHSLIYAIG